jgi:myo-inositol 2-dehydrogenase/D-chiro-inositol 1-dehydrogenase
MDFLILGDGRREREWARAIAREVNHQLVAASPGLPEFPELTTTQDLDGALALAGIQAVVVGGEPESRAEALRRVAAAGLPAICLHPPGSDSEAYYQVSMSRAETGAVIIPDLDVRHHPGVELIRRALDTEELGAFRGLRYEEPVDPTEGDLTRVAFSRAVDVVRALIGEIEAVNATGEPPGVAPNLDLVVQLRGDHSRRAEVRLWAGPREPARLALSGALGGLTLELPTDQDSPSKLTRRDPEGAETVTELPPWDQYRALLEVLSAAAAGRDSHPDLHDGTRAMEVSEGVVRSLRRGRTVDLHYEEISEAGTFKSVMTSLGCLVLFVVLIVLPIALAGPALGFGWTIYIAYLIPPMLLGFIFLQMMRFAVRDGRSEPPQHSAPPR